MWQDLSPFLSGIGPDLNVLDSSGNPTIMLSAAAGGSVQVQWSFTGGAVALLGSIEFTATLYADPIGPGGTVQVDQASVVPVTPIPTSGPVTYQPTITIPPNTLVADAVYVFTVIITVFEVTAAGTVQLPMAGFAEGPLIAVTA
jgi:hypothetical protein